LQHSAATRSSTVETFLCFILIKIYISQQIWDKNEVAMRFFLFPIGSVVILLLSGCTSFDGRPSPVLSMTTAVNLVQETYPPSLAISTFNSKAASERRAYRDEVIFVYLTAVDARYQNFLIGLSRQNKGANLLLDSLTLGLTGGASLAGETTANALSAGAAFATGAQGKINERLFYEKSLPALVSMMEAERNKKKADIIKKVVKLDAADYGMAEALADISEFQDAATMERAITLLTEVAGAKSKTASEELDTARQARLR
jgi:hypothetical protein